ncbi:hypothetical protein A8M77_18375 [Variovorax sp. JS1663]|nr:hypothetical protein A8M77_18375 [Variovorax sp. JS1663]
MSEQNPIARLLKPRSVAVIGASADPGKTAGRPVAYLQKHGFSGTIYPVNPRAAEIGGLKSYPDVATRCATSRRSPWWASFRMRWWCGRTFPRRRCRSWSRWARPRIDAALLERLPRLRLISQTGKLAGHVDLEACTARGVERDNYERYFGIAFDHVNRFAEGSLTEAVNPEALAALRR